MLSGVAGPEESLGAKLGKWNPMLLTALGTSTLLIITFLIFYLINPKTSVIYYEGNSEVSVFDVVNVREFQLAVRTDQSNGKIVFGAVDSTDVIQVIDQAHLLNLSPSPDKQQGIEPYLFLKEATLSSSESINLTINMPDDTLFSYQLEIHGDGTTEGGKNRVSIRKISKDAEVYIYSSSPIDMKGNTKQMPAGRYLIRCCDSIQFDLPYGDEVDASGQVTEDLSVRKNEPIQLSGEIRSFRIRNSERAILEFTVDAHTEFKEIGHIDLEGTVEKNETLFLSISDLAGDPVPVILSGKVKDLTMAGNSLYLTPSQWLRENMTEILLALIGLIFSVIIVRPSTKE